MLRASLLKQAPRMVKYPEQATAASWTIRERNFGREGKFCCCPALSWELGLILLTCQVVRGSAGLCFVMLVVFPFVAPSGDRRCAMWDDQTCDESSKLQLRCSGTVRILASPMQAAGLHTRGLGPRSLHPPGASIPQ